MPLSGTPLAPVDTVTANIYPPQTGTPVQASDVEAGEQMLLNRTHVILFRHHALGLETVVGPGALWNNAGPGYDGAAIQEIPAGVQSVALLDFHHGVKLTTIKVRVVPGLGHVGLPGTFPEFRFYRINLEGTSASMLSNVFDTAASVAAYETPHDLTLTLNTVIDKTAYIYFAMYRQESGANAIDGGIGQPRAALVAHSP